MKRCVVVVLWMVLSGCTSMSDTFGKSPCACNYDYWHQEAYAEVRAG